MELTIEQALGNQWAMFYHPQWPVEDLLPGCTLEQSVSTTNQQLQIGRIINGYLNSKERTTGHIYKE